MLALPIRKPEPAAAPVRVLQRKCACGGSCPSCADKEKSLQRKLAIGAANDPLEHEADRIAEQVLARGVQSDFSSVPISVRRHAAGEAEQSEDAPASVDRALAMSGRPLDASLRRDMEARFGHDFSQVRVHQGSAAEQSARDVGAQAYTVGGNIVFGTALFRPDTDDGRRLLAHELTHVVQQRGSGGDCLQRKSDAAPGICGGAWTCHASPCEQPDPGREGSGTSPTTWTLKVMIDVEAPTLKSIGAATVGHTYVEFLDSTGKAYTFGFYPSAATIPGLRPSVPGCTVHPDTNHASCIDYVEEFKLAKEEYEKALSFSQTYCKSPENYHITDNNCTTFASNVAIIAGRSLPAMRGRVGGALDADNPNTLMEGLEKRDAGPAYVPMPDTSALESDTEMRAWVAGAKPAELTRILMSEAIRIVTRLLEGWVTDDDITAIEKICASMQDSGRKKTLQKAIGPLEETLFSERQRLRLHNALFSIGPGDFPKSKANQKSG